MPDRSGPILYCKADRPALFTKFTVIDGFLGDKLSAELLRFALGHEEGFVAAGVTTAEDYATVDSSTRNSVEYHGELGETGEELLQILNSRADELFTAVALDPILEPIIEIVMAAHRDGGFFRSHVDTFTDSARRFSDSDRILSAVYYFNKEPSRFTGGNLAILPIGGVAEPEIIEPRHDRLVLFPSFAPHEVLPISVPGDAFSDARFSVNCWFRRTRV